MIRRKSMYMCVFVVTLLIMLASSTRAVQSQQFAPDLTPTAFTAPASAVSGQEVTVAWEVKNQGDGRAEGGWYDVVYFSTDNVWDGQDQALSIVWRDSALDVNQTYTQSVAFNLPRVPAGSYYLVVRIDDPNYCGQGGCLYESNESNNDRAIAITVTQPDLTPTAFAGPASAVSGQEVTVAWEVKNQGDGRAEGGWYDVVYFSTDNVWDGQDQALSIVWRDSALDVNQTYTQSVAFNLPRVPAGSYYLVVRIDDPNYCGQGGCLYESNESNNDRAIAITVTQPDLTPTAFAGPASAVSGQEVTVAWEVKNQGDGRAEGGWYDVVYFSTDNVWDGQDQALSIVWRDSALDVNQTYTQSVAFNLPRVPAGSYYLVVRIDDPNYCGQGGCLYESNESNNDRAIAITVTQPDLTPTAFAGPASAVSGQEVTVAWEVKNQGDGRAEGGWYDVVYFSTDNVWDGQDQALSIVWRDSALDVNQTYTQSVAFNLPRVPAGSYYLVVRIDDPNYCGQGGCLYESNESNNDRAIAITVTQPDLTPTAFAGPASAVSGQEVTVAWEVKNQGDGRAEGGWYDVVYFSTDNVWDGQDQALSIVWRDSALDVNQTYTQSVAFNLPRVPAGSYYLVVRIDDPNYCGQGGCLYESNESNNDRAIAITVTQPDLTPTMVQALLPLVPGWMTEISWAVLNLGNGYALGNIWNGWADTLYFSRDDVLDSQDERLGEFRMNAPLAPGSSYTQTQSIYLPNVAPGVYHLFVRTDEYDEVFERNEANNQIRQFIQLQAPERISMPWRALDSSQLGNFNLGWIDFSPNGNRIVAATGNRAVVWDIHASQPRLQFTGHSRTIDTVEFSPSGSQILSGARDGTSRIWDASTGQQVRTFAATVGQSNPATFSQDGAKVFAGSGLGLPRLWDRLTGAELRTFPGHTGTVNAVALSPDGTKALTGSADDTAIIWDVVTGAKLFTLAGHIGDVLSVAFSPDGLQALTSSTDSSVRIWNTSTGKEVRRFLHGWSHMTSIAGAAFSPDGRYVITHDSNWPGTAYLWEISSQSLLRIFSVEDTDFSAIGGVAFSPDQTLVATSHSDGQIRFWRSGLDAVSLQPILPLQMGAPHTFALQSYGLYYFEVNVASGRNLVVSLSSTMSSLGAVQGDSLQFANLSVSEAHPEERFDNNGEDAVRIAIRKGRLPTSFEHDYFAEGSLSNLKFEIPIESTFVDSKYYILVYSPYLAAGSLPVTINAEYSDFRISSVIPNRAGNRGDVTVAIRGTGLNTDAEIALVNRSGARIAASNVGAVSEILLYATFNLNNAAPGPYDLIVRRVSDGIQRYLDGGFEVVVGAQGRLKVSLDGPDVIRPGRTYQYRITYENVGDADLPAPFLSVSTTSSGALLSAAGYTSTNQLIWLAPGDDSPGNVLPPGQGGTLLFNASFEDGAALVVGVIEENDRPFDWSSFEQHLRPADMSDEEWRAFWTRTTGQIGSTNREVLETLRQLNLDSGDANDLVSMIKLALYIAAQSESRGADLKDVLSASVDKGEKYDPTTDVKIIPAPGTIFNPNKPAIMVTHGWHGKEDEDRFIQLVDKLAKNYPTHNVVRIIWEKGADAFFPRDASKNIPAAAEQAVKLLQGLHYSDWSQTIYIGESFGNGINAEMSQMAPARGKALILNAANPVGYPDGLTPKYKEAFSDSISIRTWDLADDGPVGKCDLLYPKPIEEHCGGKECNRWGQSHTSVVRLITRLFDSRPDVAKQLVEINRQGFERPDGQCNVTIDSDGQMYVDGIKIDVYFAIQDMTIRPQTGKDVRPVRAIDPNDKIGPIGISSQRLVASDTTLNYTINFENMRTATAPVQELVIIDYLDSDLDWTSFQYGQLAYSDHQVSLPNNTLSFEIRDLPPPSIVTGATEGAMAIDISASLDPQTGKIEWRLKAIDTGTEMFPDDPLAGFLPPEDGSGRGMGFVTFSIKPKAGSPPGATITNKASIVFDTNAPIETNEVLNTIGVAADLSLSISGIAPNMQFGETFAFTISVFNDGPNTAQGVVVTNTLPSGITLVSANSSIGACTVSANGVRCSLGDLPTRSNATIQLRATADKEGTYQTTAGVVGASTVIDINPLNNRLARNIVVAPKSQFRLFAPLIVR
ncbi:MAG: DUF11 domain-containing protein [Caldilinea sp.]|nr:DUF11 domain-containing protein [Caldilinea sp.]